MNSLLLLLVMYCYPYYSLASNCTLKEGTFYYIEIDIRSSSAYPVAMAGVIKNADSISLSKENVGSFLKSFYEQSYYVPDLYKGYNKIIIECMGDSASKEFLSSHKDEGLRIQALLDSNSRREKLILKTGENVFVNSVKITGSFWVVEKNFSGVAATSNEIDINEIKEIEKVYIPYKIYNYKKPKKKCIKEILN